MAACLTLAKQALSCKCEGRRASLARHLPGYEVRSVAELGEGLDNAVYAINDELTVWDYERDPNGA